MTPENEKDDLAVVSEFLGDFVREIATIAKLPRRPREAFANALADAVWAALGVPGEAPVRSSDDPAEHDLLVAVGRFLGADAMREIAPLESAPRRAQGAFFIALGEGIEEAKRIAEEERR